MSETSIDDAAVATGTRTFGGLAPPVALLVLLVGMTFVLTIAHGLLLRQTRDWVNHTHEVIETSQQVFSDALDVESGARGFLATSDARFLDAFNLGLSAFPADAARLGRLVRDNPEEVARVARLNALLKYRIDFAVRRGWLVQHGRIEEARSDRTINGDQAYNGKQAMDQARVLLGQVLNTEQTLLQRRNADAVHAEMITFGLTLTISLLAAAGLTMLLFSMVESNRRMAREITERKAAEVARRESEALYRAIFTNAADCIYVVNVSPDGQLTVGEMNPAFEQATGWSSEALRGQDISKLAEQGIEPRFERLRHIAATGTPLFVRNPPLALGGRMRTWETTTSVVRGEGDRVERIVGVARDVTERDQAEEQLRRVHRMEAVGHLTGGVAHDFNNLLQVIRGNLELLAPLLVGQEQALDRLRNALRGADRAAQLTRQLLAFARRQPLEPRVVNLGRLVDDMAEMLRRTLGESIEVETILAGGLWNTLADPTQVESAILNLALNARDAMPAGGKLTVEVTNTVLDQFYANRDTEIEPGQYVLLAVSDTGHGMSKEILARVFEPFFTTKTEEKGTGLGLSMVYGFVKQSHGHIQIYSELGQGTTVKIYLPRVMHAESDVPVPVVTPTRGASEVILVVEDDEMVRNAAAGLLRSLGYVCLPTSDGAAALEILESGAKVDLLFTDVIMPGPVKSRELARRALALRPGLPVLFTSGYTDNAIVHQGRLDEGVQLLSKPYTHDELARRIGDLLAAARPVVLVVEDDGLVRMSAVDMIESLGFAALEAGDADAGLNILKSSARVDVLFTDVGLPGMRGPQFARLASELRPNLKIIFASGYVETAETSAVAGAMHLAKPYEQGRLAEMLAAALG